MNRVRAAVRAAEALVLLLGATALRRCVAMRRWAPALIGRPQSARAQDRPSDIRSYADDRVRRAVRAAARRSPVPFSCLDEAVAGALMLRRRGFAPAVVVGLPTSDERSDSHAWLLGSCDAIILGDESAPDYAPVTVFRRGRG